MAMRELLLRWRNWLGPVLVVLAGFLLRAGYYTENYGHPDETITVEVVGHLRSSGDWDTNWAKAPNLESTLRYDQYNFSSHLYATYFFYRAVKWVPGLDAWRSRDNGFWVYRFFSVLLAPVVVWQTWWLARRVAGDGAGLVAGALVAVVPLLVQDAHYMRPEAWVTALTMGAAMACLPAGDLKGWRIFVGAVLMGLAIACKFSLLALVWLPLVPVLAAGWTGCGTIGRVLGAAGWALLGIGVGFALGAPNAIVHPQVFLHGMNYLSAHYAGLHPPYSHVDGGPVAGMLGGYFLATLGVPALAAGGVGARWLLVRRRWAEAMLLAGPVGLFAGYFCTRSVFFERNLSHVVPLFCVLAGVGVVVTAGGLAARWGGQILAVTVLVCALVILRPAELSGRLVFADFSGRNAANHEVLEAGIRAAHPEKAWWIEAILNGEPLDRLVAHFEKGGAPVVLRVIDYHDEWSARYGAMLPARLKVELIAEFPSTFADVPNCTLHTYNSWTDRYYLVRGVQKP